MRFVHDTLPQRIRFASGEARAALAAEVALLGSRRIMVIAAEPEQALADEVTGGLPVAVRHSEVVMHVPVEVAQRARLVAAEHDIDLLVSVGGGSTTGLAKAVALTTGQPIVCVPTTYAGSEATNMWGLTEASRKTTGVDPRVLPLAVVYDASLTTSLPVELSVASGLNALAHCVDSMWAPRADPINAALALEGIRALRIGLAAVIADPTGLDGREHALYGAYLAAVSFASAGSGLHHKICHVLGGMFDLPHAQTHAVVLAHVTAFNVPSAPVAGTRIATALSSADAVSGINGLGAQLGAPTSLRDLGMPEDGIEAAADAVVDIAPADNPTPVTHQNIVALLRAAWDGRRPR